jgi:hypothetical protein
MNVYLISARPKRTYHIYRSATVLAETPEAAARIHPDGRHQWSNADGCWVDITDGDLDVYLRTWVTPDEVTVEFIAAAPVWDWERVLCANFFGS